MKELAVLIPSYNGGERLAQSVRSCAYAGLEPGRYSLLVIDNCSTDGSIEALPAQDDNGVPVQVFRNESNLGRVGNWNQALAIAAREGFTFAVFLFVGDRWTEHSSIGEVVTLIKQAGAVMGMASLRIQPEAGASLRKGARISIEGRTAVLESNELLQCIAETGRLPFAPLQANVYRLFDDNPLRFATAPERALNTDMESTVTYLAEHEGRVVFHSQPFLVWQEDSQRFFGSQDPWSVMEKTRASLRWTGEVTGLQINWENANAVSLLTAVHDLSRKLPLKERLTFAWRVFLYLRRTPGGLSGLRVLTFTLNKIIRNKSYLVIGAGTRLRQSVNSKPSEASEAISRYWL